MTTCPNCGGERVHRTVARMMYAPTDYTVRRYLAGYYSCLDCWCRFDGITDPPGLNLPVGVIAREEASDD